MGDLPIYVAHDSADVWANPDLFQLDAAGDPAVMSGVPPDYFSATGQLWGNPIYRWDRMARPASAGGSTGYSRGAHAGGPGAVGPFPRPGSLLGSAGRRDHGANGRWVKGPGPALFEALEEALGELPIVAENLGVITPEVEAIRTAVRLSGHGHSAVRVRQGPAGARFQAAQLSARPRGIYGHAR
jgi:4-alpha-glucanotransferase